MDDVPGRATPAFCVYLEFEAMSIVIIWPNVEIKNLQHCCRTDAKLVHLPPTLQHPHTKEVKFEFSVEIEECFASCVAANLCLTNSQQTCVLSMGGQKQGTDADGYDTNMQLQIYFLHNFI